MKAEEYIQMAKKYAHQGMDYDEIISKLELNTSDPAIRKAVFGELSQFIAEYELWKQQRSKFLTQTVIGLIFIVIGLWVTFYTWSKSQGQFVLAYGAILGGIWASISGFRNYKRPIDDYKLRKNSSNRVWR